MVLVILLFVSFCLLYSCGHSGEEHPSSAYHASEDRHFVGSQTCRSCHLEEWDSWKGSHHDLAMAEAGERTVRGDFGDAVFDDGQDLYRFFRRDEAWLVEAPGPDGGLREYEVAYTFGWEPLQQYLVDFGSGKYQALRVAWDTERERWFSLHPHEAIPEDDWLHWTGGAMNWNTMCADCHSTNLRQNYDPRSDSFHTTWSEINVSCEACHGPGAGHVAFMESEESVNASIERIRRDLRLSAGDGQLTEINSCAPCHALRQDLTGRYVHGDPFLDHYDPTLPVPGNYHPDGQILEEVFELGSFLQSKMFAHGVSCSDCHNPHSLELKASIHDNRLCMQCHEPHYNTPEHHFHPVETESSQCINCHMPGRYYMEVDYRRDHSFRVPRPDQSLEFGTPNACSDCHTDRSVQWLADVFSEWYGEERPPHYSDHFLRADAEREGALGGLRDLMADTSQTGIVQAAAVWHAGRIGNREAFDLIESALRSSEPLVRSSAAKALAEWPADERRALLASLLADPVRAVRIAAVQGLTAFEPDDMARHLRRPFEEALGEYRAYLDQNLYFPQGQMNLGQFHENRGETESAIDAYRFALERDPYFYPARMNLALLYNTLGSNELAESELRRVIEQEPELGRAWYSLALLLAEEERLGEAIGMFDRAAEQMPEYGRLFYNRAIAHQMAGEPSEAEASYRRAIELEPENGDYRYGLVTLLLQERRQEEALREAEELLSLFPGNAQLRELVEEIRRRM